MRLGEARASPSACFMGVLVLSKAKDELTAKAQRTQREFILSALQRRVAQALACTPQAEACGTPIPCFPVIPGRTGTTAFFAVLRRGQIFVY